MEIYRNSPLFRQLRRPADFEGICGACEYNTICGGSRSRAFALTGNFLASDPWCAYRPAKKSGATAHSAIDPA